MPQAKKAARTHVCFTVDTGSGIPITSSFDKDGDLWIKQGDDIIYVPYYAIQAFRRGVFQLQTDKATM